MQSTAPVTYSSRQTLARVLFDKEIVSIPRPAAPSQKTMPSLHELKRRVTDNEVYSRSGRSDASSGSERTGFVTADGDSPNKRKADSVDGIATGSVPGDESAEVFYDCDEEERARRQSIEPPSKKSEREAARLMAKVNGKSKLRHWDSADNA